MSRVKSAGARVKDGAYITLPGGSRRSSAKAAYYLIPAAGPRRTAERFSLGAKLYGERNWTKSVHDGASSARAFAEETYNHMLEHCLLMASTENPTDDHLGAIGWAQCVLAYIEDYYGCAWTELSDTPVEEKR